MFMPAMAVLNVGAWYWWKFLLDLCALSDTRSPWANPGEVRDMFVWAMVHRSAGVLAKHLKMGSHGVFTLLSEVILLSFECDTTNTNRSQQTAMLLKEAGTGAFIATFQFFTSSYPRIALSGDYVPVQQFATGLDILEAKFCVNPRVTGAPDVWGQIATQCSQGGPLLGTVAGQLPVTPSLQRPPKKRGLWRQYQESVTKDRVKVGRGAGADPEPNFVSLVKSTVLLLSQGKKDSLKPAKNPQPADNPRPRRPKSTKAIPAVTSAPPSRPGKRERAANPGKPKEPTKIPAGMSLMDAALEGLVSAWPTKSASESDNDSVEVVRDDEADSSPACHSAGEESRRVVARGTSHHGYATMDSALISLFHEQMEASGADVLELPLARKVLRQLVGSVKHRQD